MTQIQEVFGKFAVDVSGVVKLFDTLEEAQATVDLLAEQAELRDRAAVFVATLGLSGKAATAKINTIVAFLVYEATPEEEEEDTDVDAEQ